MLWTTKSRKQVQRLQSNKESQGNTYGIVTRCDDVPGGVATRGADTGTHGRWHGTERLLCKTAQTMERHTEPAIMCP